MDTRTIVNRLARACEAAGDCEDAVAQARYMKSALRFAGVKLPFLRAQARPLARELDRERVLELASALFATDSHDLRGIAVGVLEAAVKKLEPADVALVESLVRAAAAWSHVDWLATKVAGPLVARMRPAQAAARLRGWARDEDFWVRRLALLAPLDELRAGRGDLELWAELATRMLGEREFFIRKAIGWVLRDVSRKRPEDVASYVRAQASRLSPLSFREATRRLPEALRAELEGLRAR